MRKTIKVDEQVYNDLDNFREKRETFSQAIVRLLALMSKVGELRSILEGGIKYEQWRKDELDKISRQADAGDSQKVTDMHSG